jgi:hypothetical protein
MTGDTLAQRVERRRTELTRQRLSFIAHWRELCDYLSPRTARFLSIERHQGAKANDRIINSTGTTSLRTLKSGMMAGITSPARPWFRLTAPDDGLMASAAVKQWLFDVESAMRVVLARSNFYNTLPPVYGSLGAYGTAAMAIVEDDDTVIRCESFPVGSYCIAVDDTGRVDTFLLELSMTVRQVVMQFGIAGVTDSVRSAFETGNREMPVAVCHLVEKNLDRDWRRLDARHKPFRSVYWEVGRAEQGFLKESGFDEFPVMAPRWDVFDGTDIYGYSPGMDTLGDIRQLQLMEKRKAQAIDILVRPPMLADASLRTRRTSILPGDVTYIDNMAASQHAGFRPAYEINPRIDELMNEIARVENRIRHAFYEDLMLMFATSDDPSMTAREVEERHQEKLLILGPVLERLNCELLDPAIDRVFAIMRRKGLIPLPPAELQGQQLKVEYISIMAQAQKLIGVANVQQFFAFAGNLAQLKGPSVLDKINFDHAIDDFAAMQGISPKIIVSDDQVAAVRAQQATAAQMQQLMQAAPALAQGATAAKTLSETSVEGTNALTRLMGVG